MTDLLLKIDAEDLARVVPFAADNDVRYYLNGVQLEPHENGVIVHKSEPGVSWRKRFAVAVMALLPIEWLL